MMMKLTNKFIAIAIATLTIVGCLATQDSQLTDSNLSSDFNQPSCGLFETAIDSRLVTIKVEDSKTCEQLGQFPKWQKVELFITGPQTSVTADPNPFKTEVMVTFENSGERFEIPAFYDGNGHGGSQGNMWKVRFSPNKVGNWTFKTVSSDPDLNGYQGSFTVDEASETAANFIKWGILQYTGEHYLKFADGDYWIKGGSDAPENILGKALGNWQEKKSAMDYLASKGVNSTYIITQNIDGDRKDVWPWLGDTQKEAKKQNDRFNIVKLQQWEEFFSYLEQNGIALHILFDDDSAWHNYDRDLYYREMIARFAHHPALIWNVGEEANEIYSNQEQIEFAGMITQLDPYDHPVTVHRKSGLNKNWPFLGETNFQSASVQLQIGGEKRFSEEDLSEVNQIVQNNRSESINSGHPIPIMLDEVPAVDKVNDMTRFKLRSDVLYGAYLAGGNFELFYRAADFVPQDLEPMWNDMRYARQFVAALPFKDMAPRNELLSDSSVGNYVLAQPGVAYGIYLKAAREVELDLREATGNFQVKWYNPTTGEYQDGNTIKGGGVRSLGNPPFSEDVAVAVTKITTTSSASL